MASNSVWVECNPNPAGRKTGDCAVRAIALVLGISWDEAYALLCAKGYEIKDLPNNDSVWSSVLRDQGFTRTAIPDTCPSCYTATDFCDDHPKGRYVLSFGHHIAAVIDGYLKDAWDSSKEIPQYYWAKEGT